MSNKNDEKHNNLYNSTLISKQTIFYINVFFTTVYLLWRILKTIPFEYGTISLIAGVILLVVEIFGFFEATIHYSNLRDVKTYDLPEIPQEAYPHVDIFISTYNEDEDILFKTINGCLYMDYPDKNKVHIYLCDDNRRPTMRALAEKMGVGYFDRENNQHAKAGNLNNAFSKTQSPYIVTFDADMIPQRNFLLETIPYFIKCELENKNKKEDQQIHIGFVQTPQAYYNPDLFQFNLFSESRIPNEQDYFYRDIQISRNKTNSVIYGGSNTVISRQAISDIGGFYTKSITEDYATGILIQRKGYTCIAIDKILASGLSPTTLKGLINQRIRWARGVISANRKLKVFSSKDLTINQKLNYWASMQYWNAPFKRLCYFLSPILYSVFGYVVLKCTLSEILIFWLPMYISSDLALRILSTNLRTTKWNNVYETTLFPFLLIPVFLETFGFSLKEFKVTEKSNHSTKGKTTQNLLYLLPFGTLSIFTLIGILNSIKVMITFKTATPSVILFWLIFNFFTLTMSMFFVLGRNILRKSERTSVETDCTIITRNETYYCKTNDLSETGLSLIVDKPIFINPDALITLRIRTDKYYAELRGKVVHVSDRENDWKYAFYIYDFLDGYCDYLQILYDRIPTLPQSIITNSNSFDDLKINISKRLTKTFLQSRVLPRVRPRNIIKDTEGDKWEILDYNFLYVTIKDNENFKEELSLVLNEDLNLILKCSLAHRYLEGKLLYGVDNVNEIDSDVNKRRFVHEWVSLSWEHRNINNFI